MGRFWKPPTYEASRPVPRPAIRIPEATATNSRVRFVIRLLQSQYTSLALVMFPKEIFPRKRGDQLLFQHILALFNHPDSQDQGHDDCNHEGGDADGRGWRIPK